LVLVQSPAAVHSGSACGKVRWFVSTVVTAMGPVSVLALG
jgi:hypothetical protein